MTRRSTIKRIKAPGSSRKRIQPRGWRKPVEDRQPLILGDGTKLNAEEAIIYKALVKMGINFKAQQWISGGVTGHGGLVDFALWDYHIAIEHQTRFHEGSVGQAKDFLRKVARADAGLVTVYTYTRDLDHIEDTLRQIISAPTIAALSRGR